MKSHSSNYFLATITVIGVLFLIVIGINMTQRVHSIEQTFDRSHIDAAADELKRGMQAVIAKSQSVANSLAIWDETSQQLSDPTYYKFWRDRRVHAVQFIPKYIEAVELYDKNMNVLQPNHDTVLPNTVPKQNVYIEYANQQYWLCLFKQIKLSETQDDTFGYVALKINLLSALLDLNRFSHIDTNSLTITPSTTNPTSPQELYEKFQYSELHNTELTQFKNIIYETFGYFSLLVLFIIGSIYIAVVMLFAGPLNRLNQYVTSLSDDKGTQPDLSNLFSPVTEFNNFTKTLHDYQRRLKKSQDTLQYLNHELEKRVESRTIELKNSNNELEAFSYSVSHDLRAPLRSIDGFSLALKEDYVDKLDDQAIHLIDRVRHNTHIMAELINDMLDLSRISRRELVARNINLSHLANNIISQLQEQFPERVVSVKIQPDMYLQGDEHLLSIMLSNLISNAWKYSNVPGSAEIEIGCKEENSTKVFYIKDNGSGFDMQYSHRLFEPFQRLHGSEFEGTGIGLATVKRIIQRHYGNIWAESKPNQGACFYFTLNQSYLMQNNALQREIQIPELADVIE